MSRSQGSSPVSRCSSTGWIWAGATSRVAIRREKSVPTTASSPSLSRTPCAISSRPVASGNFLGALRLVAGPPPEIRPILNLLLQFVDAVHQRFGPRRAARHVDVHRQELIHALDD